MKATDVIELKSYQSVEFGRTLLPGIVSKDTK
jgi:hypothetical protein